ncbi:sensor histidine kinase [Asticcacaulis benevestitus]|uniref:histidine kinase n=1 Tax=Asticcacaulis benevestitus DSM 16100 = ATCC BAA-896 TaxID=1121022 RepID=V4QRS6_9CAUL|nr:ATP-binding protein [Asticcacaulis benevestitus]ESQ81898.1 hypothetical protein ABENE_21420 [Asticcacaulis benevestitus DSM 16100 = ATCC BAA-896]
MAGALRQFNPLHRLAGQSLFTQIAARLALVTLAFVILEVLFVVGTYQADVDEVNQGLVAKKLEQVLTFVDSSNTPAGRQEARDQFRKEAGATKVAFVVFDHFGQVIATDNPFQLPLPTTLASSDLQSSTSRFVSGDRYQLSATRVAAQNGRRVWVALTIQGQGKPPFTINVINEIIEHVALPMLPLSILLLILNGLIVRHMLAPLNRAVLGVENLSPSQISNRLTPPDSPREVRALVLAINEALDRMETAILTLRQFTADAAHELRTPLAVMLLAVDELPDSAAKKKLRCDTQGMTRLVNQMLDMALAESLTVAAGDTFDLGEVAQSVVMQLTPLAVREGRSISFFDAESTTMPGHRESFSRALRNIIENAITYSPPATAVEVTVGPGAQCSVRDFGPGIPEDVRAKIFDRFWRGDKAHKVTGTGLGLGIALSIVEAHNGKILVEAPDGGGTLVRMVFGGLSVDVTKSNREDPRLPTGQSEL